MLILNDAWETDHCPGKEAAEEAAADLVAGLEAIHALYYHPYSNTFDYAGFAGSADFERYETLARALVAGDPAWFDSPDRRLSFWLNAYNMLVIHSVVVHNIDGDLREAKGFYSDNAYRIGAHWFNLDIIEHGILRANAKKYHALTAPLARHDERLAYAIDTPDPRIHFAMYSACRSSPPWRVYRAERIDEQLRAATQVTLQRDLQISDDGLLLLVPRPFKWYERDFGSKTEVLKFIAEHMVDSTQQAALRANIDRVELDYLGFDWLVNK